MSDSPQGPGWWQASDGRWYPPHLHPSAQQQPPPQYVGPPPVVLKQRSGCWTAALIIAAVGIVGLVGCVALVATSVDDAAQEQDAQDAAERDDATIVECGTDELGLTRAVVKVTNNSSKRSNYMVDVVFESADGATQFDSSAAFINNVRPGQTATGDAVAFGKLDVPAGSKVTCSITDVDRISDEG